MDRDSRRQKRRVAAAPADARRSRRGKGQENLAGGGGHMEEHSAQPYAQLLPLLRELKRRCSRAEESS